MNVFDKMIAADKELFAYFGLEVSRYETANIRDFRDQYWCLPNEFEVGISEEREHLDDLEMGEHCVLEIGDNGDYMHKRGDMTLIYLEPTDGECPFYAIFSNEKHVTV